MGGGVEFCASRGFALFFGLLLVESVERILGRGFSIDRRRGSGEQEKNVRSPPFHNSLSLE